MNKVISIFDYEKVKEIVKKHYPNENYELFDKMPDNESCYPYLDLFSEILSEYGVIDDSVLLVEDEYQICFVPKEQLNSCEKPKKKRRNTK